MKVLSILIALMLSGCVIRVEDQRLTRHEIAQAFQERDKNILDIAQKVAELDKKEK